MPIRLAILGLDPLQQEWLDAIGTLVVQGEIELTGVAHHSLALAKDVAEGLKLLAPPTFDDLRLFLKEAAPQVIVMDRPSNVSVEFLTACVQQGIGLVSLGPPVENLAEAQALSDVLEAQSHLLYIWPRFTDSPAYRRCTQADEFVRPIKFAAATWMGMNHALAKTARLDYFAAQPAPTDLFAAAPPFADFSVRSLSVLAWDALATLIDLIGLPTSVYAAIRGTVGSGDTFVDISGAASVTLRFPEDALASLSLSDRMPTPSRRDLLLLGQGGTVKLEAHAYDFRDGEGKLIDAGRSDAQSSPNDPPEAQAAGSAALDTLREYLRHFQLPPSPHRGWPHRLREVAATMEALLVSHRTGQAESPERFLQLRR
jgi:predicted dehydrogenase